MSCATAASLSSCLSRATRPIQNVLREAFAREHERRYGYRDDGAEIELVTMRVSAWGAAPQISLTAAAGEGARARQERVEGPASSAP